MTATDATPTPVDAPTRDLTALSALCLLAAPLVALLARVLSTPWHQDETDHLDANRYLTEVADAATRNDLGAGLTFVSAVLFAGVAVVLARIVRERSPRISLVGAILSVIGAFGLASVGVASMTFGQIARMDERDTMISLMDRLYDSAQTGGVFFLAMLVGAVGAVLLAIGLYRSRAVPRAAAVLSGIGTAAVLITATGPMRGFVVGSAVIATVGLWWIAVSLWSRRAATAAAGLGAALALAGGLILVPDGSAEDGRAAATTLANSPTSVAPVQERAVLCFGSADVSEHWLGSGAVAPCLSARADDRHRNLLMRRAAHQDVNCVLAAGGERWIIQAARCRR
jgi:MFS family permease